MRALVLVAAAACHHAQVPPPAPPDYHPIAGDPLPARGQVYVDCLGDAVAAKHIAYAHDPDTDLLLFTCSAEPAHAFFDALAGKGAEVETDGKTLRSTNPVRRNLYGVDYCARAGSDYACVITLNAGRFLR